MPSGSRRAVVIGLNEYADRERIPSLHGAVNDATEIYRNLTLFGDFEVADRHFLTDEKGTSENIRRAISDLFWKLEPCELALLYFSGHGLQDGYGNGYLAPHDIRYDEPFVRGIKVQELRELFLAAKNKEQVLLILDCCHSGIVVEGDKDFPQTTGPFYQSLSASEDDIAAAGRGKFILASSGPDEKSRETRQPHRIRSDGESEHMHGLFTFHLLEGLNGRAADRNHRITLGRLHEYVTRQMEECKGHECFYWGFGSG